MIKKLFALCLAVCMCLAVLPLGARSASADAALTGTGALLAAPTITTQPENKTVAVGKSVTFSVAAGSGVTYQWEYSKNNGSSWTTWSGKTSASLKVTGSKTNNGCLYRCVVTDSTGSVTSKSARLTVSGVKPAIVGQPKAKKTDIGSTVTFKVVAAGVDLSYQWQYSKDGGSTWTTWSGKTSASLKVTGSTTNNGCLYRCVVKNSKGSVTSEAAKLTVNPVKITTQPTAQKGAVGTKITFSVEALGTNLTYQWQYSADSGKTWKDCSSTGYNKASFSFKTARSMDGRLYRCVVKSGSKSETSEAAKLTVPLYTAILVGENDYPYSSDVLRGCVNDINAMAGMLGGLRAKYTIKKLPNSTRSEIMNAISAAAKTSKSYDILYFYYSGHGVGATPDGYTFYYSDPLHGALVPIDYDYIKTSELAEALSQFKGKVYVFLDSCYSGSAIRSAGGDDPLEAFNNDVIDVFSGYEFREETDVQPGTKYGELKQSKFTVLTAASYTQTSAESGSSYYSWDGNYYYFGAFTRVLLEGTNCVYPNGTYVGGRMQADDNNDSRVTLGEMRDYIYEILYNMGYSQSVQYYGDRSTVLFRR